MEQEARERARIERRKQERRIRRRRARKRKQIITITLLMSLLAVLIFKAVSAGGKKETETTKTIEVISSGQQEETENQKEAEIHLYGCELHGTYEYPFNTMSQD